MSLGWRLDLVIILSSLLFVGALVRHEVVSKVLHIGYATTKHVCSHDKDPCVFCKIFLVAEQDYIIYVDRTETESRHNACTPP